MILRLSGVITIAIPSQAGNLFAVYIQGFDNTPIYFMWHFIIL